MVHTIQFGGIKGRNLTDAHAHLSNQFHHHKHTLLSLDYQKCFDNTHPRLILEIFRRAGLPPHLTGLLSHVWEHQQRYIQLGTAVDPHHTTVSTSLPQGDALCPAAINILLSAAARHIQNTFGHNITQVLFIDDRNLLCSSVDTLTEAHKLWNHWSTLFTLQENTTKTSITTANTAHHKQLLQRTYTQHIQPYTRVLGIDLQQNRNHISPTATKRWHDAHRIAHRLRTAPISWADKQHYWRTLILGKATWGWLYKQPPATVTKLFNQHYRLLFPGQKGGSRALTTLLAGHSNDFNFRHNIFTWRAFRRAYTSTGGLPPHDPWNKRIHHWLQQLKWTNIAPHTWTHHDLPPLRLHDDTNLQDHLIRESWRRNLFADFIRSTRRDAQHLRDWHYNEHSTATARKL